MRRWTVAIGATMAILIAGLTGCAGSGTVGSRSSAANDRVRAPASCNLPDPGVSTSALRVGAIVPTTGPDGQFFPPALAGMRARFLAENEAGGIGGRQLTLVPADDGDGLLENDAAARHLVDEEKVFGLLEVTTNGDGGASFLHDIGVPVTGWGITTAWGSYKNMFGYRYSTSPKPEGEPVTRSAEFLKAHGAHKVAVLATGATASANFANQVVETLPAVGLQAGYVTTNLSAGITDFSVEVERIRESGADSLYTGMSTASNLGLMDAAAKAGLHLSTVVFPAGYDARLAAVAGADMEGVYFAIDWRPFELAVPAHDRFKHYLAQVAPEEFPGQLAMVGWLSADAFVRGLEEAGISCPTRKAFVANLRLVGNYTADGLLPPTDFGAVFGKMPLCFYYVRLHDHAFVPDSDQPFCGVLLSDFHPS